METQFTIWYDEQPDEVVDKIGEALEGHGLVIEYDGDGGDGYQGYIITKLEE